jgi:signal transduction histidine kinase
MKLFHKFFIALLFISLVPLIVYNIILFNTTGATLRKVIDRNNINTLNNIVIEVNKFFIEVEGELNLARQIEHNPKMPLFRKNTLIMGRISSSPIVMSVCLLDENYKVFTGMAKDSVSFGLEVDKDLAAKAKVSGRVELGKLSVSKLKGQYFDLVYPMTTKPASYCYFRMDVTPLFKRINAYLRSDRSNATQEIILFDESGGSARSNPTQNNSDIFGSYDRYKDRNKEKIFGENGFVRAVSMTGGPGWLVAFSESESSAYAPIAGLELGSITLIIFSIALALFGAYLLAANLTRPIKGLVSGMDIVSKGNLNHKVPEISNDELSKLASFFNLMTVRLKELQVEMKKSERLSTIGQMSNIIGHEIRNPLSAMRNATYLIRMELAKKTDTDPNLLQRVGIIESEINVANKIINDMLDFSRTRQPVLSRHDINNLIKEVIEENPIPENIKYSLQLAEIPKIDTDIDEIRQVLRNLINNAVDSMRASGGTLTISTGKADLKRRDISIGAVFFEVADTGCGIKKEDIAKIYEPFFSTKAKGTGLGLAVVKRVVEERHNGTVDVKSEIGKGTVFTVKIPAA